MSEQFPTEPLTGDPNHGDTPGAEDAPTASWWQTVVPFAVIACVLLALLFATLVVVSGPVFLAQQTSAPAQTDPAPRIPDGPKSDPSQNAMGQPVTEDPNSAAESARAAELRAAEMQAIRSAKLEQFTTLRDQTNELLDNLATEMASWSNLSKELLDGDGGRRIASDAAYIERFLPIYEKEHVTQQQYESLQRRFVALSQPIKQAEKDATYLPSEDVLGELRVLQGEVSAALSTLASIRKDAEAIQRFSASRPASDQTLRDAIDDFRQQQQQARLEQIALRRKQAEQETAARLAEEEAKREELRRQVELARVNKEKAALVDEKQRLEAESEAEARRRQLAREKAALEREFQRELVQIKSLLRPFISQGMTQPKGNGFESADEEGPVSLARLRGTGALKPTVGGRQTLYWITSANRMNDRDLGGFPRYRGGAGDWQQRHPVIKQAQELLIKYGDLMVEKGYLAE